MQKMTENRSCAGLWTITNWPGVNFECHTRTAMSQAVKFVVEMGHSV